MTLFIHRLVDDYFKEDITCPDQQKITPVISASPLPTWIGPYISRHFLSLNPLLVRRRRYSRGERYPSALCGCHSL